MTKSTLSIRMDSDLKKQFRELCEDMGMTMTEAFTMIVNGISEAGAKGPSADEKNVSAALRQ